MAVHNALEPMNHREIEYNAAKLSGIDIPGAFACDVLIQWLDETGRRVFDDALIMDYGTDCLRLYLMFESTPRAQDAPYYESWREGALEGLYKFLGRYRRMILTADRQNRNDAQGTITEQDMKKMQEALNETRETIKRRIAGGNTQSGRHAIIAALMLLQRQLQEKLWTRETVCVQNAVKAAPDARITEICRAYIGMMAPFAPNLSRVLWEELNYQGESPANG